MSKLPMTTAGVRRGKAAPSSGCKSHPANAPAWMIVSGYTSINAVVKAELFPTKIRAIGVGFPYALTVSIFGGTADSVALWLKSLGHEDWFYYYLTGMIGISLIVYLFMRDTKADSAMHRHEQVAPDILPLLGAVTAPDAVLIRPSDKFIFGLQLFFWWIAGRNAIIRGQAMTLIVRKTARPAPTRQLLREQRDGLVKRPASTA